MPALVDGHFSQYPFLQEPHTVNMNERPDHSERETIQSLPPAVLMNGLIESVMTPNLIHPPKDRQVYNQINQEEIVSFPCIITNKL